MSPQRFFDVDWKSFKFPVFRNLSQHVLTNNVEAAFQVSMGISAVVFVSTLEVEVNITIKTHKPPENKSTY